MCECGGVLLVLKTHRRDVVSMLGPLVARETVRHCERCGRVHFSDALRGMVASGCNIAYDVLVFVGEALLLRHRTGVEVLGELAARNVRVSTSEVSYLGRKFVAYLARAHRRAVPGIRESIALTGGYVLHLDAMHAGDAPALMSGLDGLSHVVLGNAKIASEGADSVKPFLEDLRECFGTPIACVHDMGAGICAAVEAVFVDVPDFICHFHFLRDAGKDLLEPDYARLRKRLRKHAVSSRLQALVRNLAARLRDAPSDAPDLAAAILGGVLPDDPALVPAAAAYSLAQWALDGKHAGDGYGFPFDRSLLMFAERLLALERRLPELMDTELRGNWKDNAPLDKLYGLISRVAGDAELVRAVKGLRWRGSRFDSLRDAMRIARPDGPDGLNDTGDAEDMAAIQANVEAFRRELDSAPQLATDSLCTKLAVQLDKYGDKLFADPIAVATPNGPVAIRPQRTNNAMERFFRGVRRGYRRRTGNDSMGRALRTMLADTPLVKNLRNPRYMDILLDGKPTLEALFAQIDTQPGQYQPTMDQLHERSPLRRFAKIIRLKELPEMVAKLFKMGKSGTESNRVLLP